MWLVVPLISAIVAFCAGIALAFALKGKSLEGWRELASARQALLAERNSLVEEIERQEQANAAKRAVREKDIQSARASLARDLEDLQARNVALEHAEQVLAVRRSELENAEGLFASRAVGIADFERENRILKTDLRNLDTHVRKIQMDRELQTESQATLDRRSRELAEKYLSDVEKWVGKELNANNFASCKQRLVRVIEWCREIGFDVPEERETRLIGDLKADYEKAVRAALEREEQARIKARIREEQQREREVQRELQAIERERQTLQAALTMALAQTQNQHTAEIDGLRARLAEAEARGQRAVAQAQLTKAGHIYVISNLGAFGEGVYKIGMTRRLAPNERISELGDASVPFPFDVHMMISSNDAPALENKLHKHFHRYRVNKANPRKEFFRVSLEEIHQFVVAEHAEVNYVADAEALEFRQSIEMSEGDQEYIEHVFDDVEKALGLPESEE